MRPLHTHRVHLSEEVAGRPRCCCAEADGACSTNPRMHGLHGNEPVTGLRGTCLMHQACPRGRRRCTEAAEAGGTPCAPLRTVDVAAQPAVRTVYMLCIAAQPPVGRQSAQEEDQEGSARHSAAGLRLTAWRLECAVELCSKCRTWPRGPERCREGTPLLLWAEGPSVVLTDLSGVQIRILNV